MRLEDTVKDLMEDFSVKDIVKVLADQSLVQASEMSDMQLADSAKEWSERAHLLYSMLELLM